MLRFVLIILALLSGTGHLCLANPSLDDYYNEGTAEDFDRVCALHQSLSAQFEKYQKCLADELIEAIQERKVTHQKLEVMKGLLPALEGGDTTRKEAIHRAIAHLEERAVQLQEISDWHTNRDNLRSFLRIKELFSNIALPQETPHTTLLERWSPYVESIACIINDVDAIRKMEQTSHTAKVLPFLEYSRDALLGSLPPYYKILLDLSFQFAQARTGEGVWSVFQGLGIRYYRTLAFSAGHQVLSPLGRQAEKEIKRMYDANMGEISTSLADHMLRSARDIWRKYGFFGQKQKEQQQQKSHHEVSEDERNAALRALGLPPEKSSTPHRQKPRKPSEGKRAKVRSTHPQIQLKKPANASAAAAAASSTNRDATDETPLSEGVASDLNMSFYGTALEESMITEDDLSLHQSTLDSELESTSPYAETPLKTLERKRNQGATAAAASVLSKTESEIEQVPQQRWTLREGAPAFMKELFSPHGKPTYTDTLRGLIRFMNQTKGTHYTPRRYGKRGKGSSVGFMIPSFDQRRDFPCFYHEPHGGDKKSARFVSWYIAIRDTLIEAGYATEEGASAACARNSKTTR